MNKDLESCETLHLRLKMSIGICKVMYIYIVLLFVLERIPPILAWAFNDFQTLLVGRFFDSFRPERPRSKYNTKSAQVKMTIDDEL
jgi:hypothetical protein